MKRILALAMAAIMMISLAACGEKKSEPIINSSSEQGNPIVDTIPDAENTPIVDEIRVYLADDFDYTGMTEITSMDYARFYMPNDLVENSVGYQEYMMASMLMLSAAFGGDISESGMTMEDIEKIITTPMIMEMKESYTYIDAVSPATVTVIVDDNTDNLTLDELDADALNKLMELQEEEDEVLDEHEIVEIPDEDTPNTSSSDSLLIATNPDASVDSAPDEYIGDETENDLLIDTDIGEFDDDIAYEPVDTSIKVVEEVCRGEDKVIFRTESKFESFDEEGNQVVVDMSGYAAVIIRDNKVCAAFIMYKSDDIDLDLALTIMQSLKVDITAMSTLTEDPMEQLENMFGLGDIDYDGTEAEVDEGTETEADTNDNE